MPHTHEFDCPICGAHLDSRKELAEHSREEHTHSASSRSESSDSNKSTKSANSDKQR
jgi:uncharacterized Zn finger protein (UPF0148 family)